jgi:fatty acid desaturase
MLPSPSPSSSDGPSTGPVRRRTEFAELTHTLRAAGLLERRRGWYAGLIAITLAVLAGSAVALVAVGDSWWAVGLAPVFAVVAGDAVGYVAGNLAIGLGYGRWVDDHNAHHANPNHETRDPDVHIAALAFSPEQATGRRGFTAFVTRHQAVMFFPMLLLEGLSMHVTSVRALIGGTVRARGLEAGLLAVHTVLYLGAVFLVLSPGPAVVFIAVQQGLFGLYLGAVFAPNHKGMPMVSAADQLDPIRKQVLTSRNVRGNVLVDHVMGGLNYQIEHHLFARMPRPNLRHAQPLVAAFCARQGISYAETGLLDSYAQTLRHLQESAAPARVAAP